MPRKKKTQVSPMTRKLMRALQTYIAKIEGKAHLIIEGDIDPVAEALAEVWIRRWGKDPRTHFTEGQRENIKLGFGGGWAFKSMLNQWCVPNIDQDPIFDWPVHETPYDFIISKPDGGVLRLEVKTFKHGDLRPFRVKAELWDGFKEKPDYLIALRRLPSEPSKTKHEIVGWLTGAEFDEKKRFAKKGEVSWSKYAPCYWCERSKLHDWKELEPKILECAIKSPGEVGL